MPLWLSANAEWVVPAVAVLTFAAMMAPKLRRALRRHFAVSDLADKADAILAELHPNGGSSLHDRLFRRLDEVGSSLAAHVADCNDRDVDLERRLSELESRPADDRPPWVDDLLAMFREQQRDDAAGE